MNIELVNRWADELDSNRWTQEFGYFFGETPTCACAVGVVLIMLDDQPGSPAMRIDDKYVFNYGAGHGSATSIVRQFLARHGIPWTIAGTIYGLNDGDHASFPRIALFLREQVAHELRFRAEVAAS